MEIEEPVISLIVPTYNTEKYIDKCVNSILNQDYKDLELILIDDGSSDGSYCKCKEWELRDNRIRVFYQDDVGAGRARQYCLERARGRYCWFIDSDDWIEPDSIVAIVDAMQSTRCDILLFDYYNVYEKESGTTSKQLIQTPVYTDFTINAKDSDLLINIEPSMCNKAFRRDFILKADKKWYEGRMEDLSVCPSLILEASTIGQIRAPFYNYRRRSGSASSDNSVLNDMVPALEQLLMNSVGSQYYSEQRMYDFCRFFIYGTLKCYFGSSDCSDDYRRLLKISEDFMKRSFNKDCDRYFNKRVVLFGSYSLRKIYNFSDYLLDTLSHHYAASSVISMMDSNIVDRDVKMQNKFREQAVSDDLRKTFLHEDTLLSMDYFIFDLINEQYGVSYVDGTAITDSEYAREANLPVTVNRIGILDSEYFDRFVDKFAEFKNYVSNYISADRVVMVRDLLAGSHGIYGRTEHYDNYEEICKINDVLNRMYDHIVTEWNGIKVVTPDEKLIFTYDNYAFGCYPGNYNAYMISETGKLIKSAIQENA